MRGSVVVILQLCLTLTAATAQPGAVALTDSLGVEIDASEQARYHLLPDIEGFVSARLVETPEGGYRLYYVTREPRGERERGITVSPLAFEHTRRHAELVERYLALREAPPREHGETQSCARHACLMLAARGEYAAASCLADAALSEGDGDNELAALRSTTEELARSRGLFLPGSLYDRSGRTELLVFSGYYGLWLGIATPIALQADNGSQVGVSLLVIPTASVLLASRATRRADIGDGRVGMIMLGGHLCTWQGIGWAAYADREGHEVTGMGALAGLAGIGAATLLSKGVDLTPGHAEIANSGLPWGAWLGAVVGVLADHEDDDMLRDMLIGSDAGVLACCLAGRDSPVSRARVRVCNMAGVLGGVCGLGLDLILDVDDEDLAMSLAAAGSLVGLYVGTHATRHMDRAERVVAAGLPGPGNARAGASLSPRLSVYTSPTHPHPTPSLEVSLRF
ncbi:MAG: hypothetical protein MUE60_03485 [Candidatus Eisenbacteria bacterium]|jgi:hypothetical protein|nr:hypothetical protein [Candidatus Eisenbacteria bacterium]